ncbi:MAG: hypothetical protein IJ009_03630 [Clostridia bacterium]|nr:hypothetical protein [Clostridia bacterium]
MKISFCEKVWQNESAELYFFENGRETGARRVFSPHALLGLTLVLPRSLGTRVASLALLSEQGEPVLHLPLSFVEWEGEREAYAALVDDVPSAAMPLSYLSLTVECAYGKLFCVPGTDGRIGFSAYPSPRSHIPLLFLEETEQSSPLAGGSLYCLPLAYASLLDATGAEELVSSLSSLGVRCVYLCPSSREGADGEGEDPSTPLPSAFMRAAKEREICLLGDFLLLCGVTEHPDLLFGGFCSPSSQNAPVEQEPRPAFWNAPLAAYNEKPLSLVECCGEEGTIAAALRVGYDGMVVRAADCFGDAFLSAMQRSLQGSKNPVLLGGTETGSVAIAFGTRRRFFFGNELDAPLSYTLRNALLDYFLDGDTRSLAAYVHNTLATMPPATLVCLPNLLSDGAVGLFYDALSPLGETAGDFAAMAYLVAATLPGVPAYYAGEEESAWENGAALLRRVALLRKKESTYAHGDFSLLHLSPTLLVFSRRGEGESLFTVINSCEEPLTLSSPDGFFVVFGGRGRKQSFTVRPRTGIVVKIPLWENESCRLHFSHT